MSQYFKGDLLRQIKLKKQLYIFLQQTKHQMKSCFISLSDMKTKQAHGQHLLRRYQLLVNASLATKHCFMITMYVLLIEHCCPYTAIFPIYIKKYIAFFKNSTLLIIVTIILSLASLRFQIIKKVISHLSVDLFFFRSKICLFFGLHLGISSY